jgi:hypothetical protein
MIPSTREALAERRRLLLERAARDARRAEIESHLRPLREAGVEFECRDTQETPGQSVLSLFPVSFVTIDWKQVPDHGSLAWIDDDDRAAKLAEALAINGVVDAGTPLVVEWAGGPGVQVRLPLSQLARHAAVLLAMDMDTYCWAVGHRWAIEVHHDGMIHWGVAPDQG